jgi:hypothetical protein
VQQKDPWWQFYRKYAVLLRLKHDIYHPQCCRFITFEDHWMARMQSKEFILEVGEARVSAKTLVPSDMIAILTLAHGAGAGMHHPFMQQLAEELANEGIGTLRFNFVYMEQKKKRPDWPALAHEAIAAAALKAQTLAPDVPLFLSGKSFGGRMSSQWVAKHQPEGVRGLVFFGFPLHPAGKPGTERADHLHQIHLPMLFLQGSRDELASWQLIESVCKQLRTATLVQLPGADHAFKMGRENAVPILASRTKAWLVTQ